MSVIECSTKGDFSKTTDYIKRLQNMVKFRNAEIYAKKGLEALMEATPKRTGLTSRSWTYRIEQTDTSISIIYDNTNIQKDVVVAIVLDYGHYSNGHWIMGRHYIEPAIRPIFDEISNDLWEVIKT